MAQPIFTDLVPLITAASNPPIFKCHGLSSQIVFGSWAQSLGENCWSMITTGTVGDIELRWLHIDKIKQPKDEEGESSQWNESSLLIWRSFKDFCLYNNYIFPWDMQNTMWEPENSPSHQKFHFRLPKRSLKSILIFSDAQHKYV